MKKQEVTSTGMGYLLAVFELEKQGLVRQKDVADFLSVSPSSCFESVLRLIKKGFLFETDHKYLHLTPEGKEVCRVLNHNSCSIEYFFEKVLGRPKEEAVFLDKQINPYLHTDTALELCRFMNFLKQIEQTPIDFWKEWKNFSLNPETDAPCLACPYQKHCMAKKTAL